MDAPLDCLWRLLKCAFYDIAEYRPSVLVHPGLSRAIGITNHISSILTAFPGGIVRDLIAAIAKTQDFP